MKTKAYLSQAYGSS